MDLKPKGGGGSHLGKMWTFVLYPMEPLAQGGGGVFGPPPPPDPPGYGPVYIPVMIVSHIRCG